MAIINNSNNTDRRAYACRLARIKDSTASYHAHLLFDGLSVLLMSDMVDDNGNVVVAGTYPWRVVDVINDYDVTVIDSVPMPVSTYENLNALLDSFNIERYGWVDKNTGECITASIIPPPKGNPISVGHIETPSGKINVFKYPRSKQLRLIDCVSGAGADIDPSDLASYFTEAK
jgi:hypothetical protein